MGVKMKTWKQSLSQENIGKVRYENCVWQGEIDETDIQKLSITRGSSIWKLRYESYSWWGEMVKKEKKKKRKVRHPEAVKKKMKTKKKAVLE